MLRKISVKLRETFKPKIKDLKMKFFYSNMS